MKRTNVFCSVLGFVVWACVANAQVITTVVGTDWTFPPTPLPAISAPFGGLSAVAVDATGNIYVADFSNNMVFRIAPDLSLTVVAGNGLQGYSGDGGPATSASLSFPYGIAVDTTGDLYISDAIVSIVRRLTPNGIITTVAGNGTFGFSGDDGPAMSAQLGGPYQLAVDKAGNLYIADATNARIRKVTPSGIITTVAGNGQEGYSGDGGPATSATLFYPYGVAVDAAGNLYIADTYNSAVRMVTPLGTISTVPGTLIPGSQPWGMTVDAAGNLFIADPGYNVIRKRTPAGTVAIIAGGTQGFSGDGGPATAASFTGPQDVAVDGSGNLYIADTGNGRIRKISPDGIISTLAGNRGFQFAGDGGPAANAALDNPYGIALDASGSMFIADSVNERIRRVSPSGIITTVAGNGVFKESGDGGPATSASIESPLGVAVDSSEDLFIADAVGVRKVNSNGTISTVLQTPPDFSQANVAVDGAGNVYVSNAACDCIQEIQPGGAITTVAGNGRFGFSGDGGPATDAEINGPGGLTVDGAGNLYFSDQGNDRVLRVTPDGIITTVAGNGSFLFSGDGGLATNAGINGPSGLALDREGNLYIAGFQESRIRKVTPDGIITTEAGNGMFGFAGDGGLATSAELYQPNSVTVDASGNLYIADTLNNRIREVLVQAPSTQVSLTQLEFTAPSGGAPTRPQQITFTASVTGLPFTIQVSGNSWLRVTPLSGVSPRLITVSADPTNLPPGTYPATITITSPNGLPASSKVLVSFSVKAGISPLLGLDKQSLSFPFPQQGSAQTQTLTVSNSGSGMLNFTATAATNTGGNWLSVSVAIGQASPATPVTLTVTADPTGLQPGTYTGNITVSAPGNGSMVVPVTMTISSLDQAILLSQTGLAFLAVAQGGVVPPQSFAVLNIGTGVLGWSVSASTLPAGLTWLQVTPDSGNTDASASTVPAVQVSVNPIGLTAGQYYGLVRLDAPGAANTPQVLTVFLQVLPAASPTGAVVQPADLLFTATAGPESPGSQSVSVYNITATARSFQSSVSADPGLTLVTLPTNGTLDPQQPTSIVVQPFTSGLAAGIYNGTVTLQFSDGSVQTVNVRVIVTAAGSSSSPGARVRAADASPCTATQLLPALTTLAQQFAVSAGWPVALGVDVKDDCGNPLETGSVSVSFSNGDQTIELQSLKNGQWEGTWATQTTQISQVTLTLQAQDPQRQISGKREVSGATQSQAQPPTFPLAGVVSAAGNQSYVALAPGGIISIYGNYLAEETASASSVPLPTELPNTDTQVFMAGLPLPLYYVGQTQINAVVPNELNVNTKHYILVQRGNTLSQPVLVDVAAAQPAVFTLPTIAPGQGAIIVVPSAGSTQKPFVNSPAAPAHAGDYIEIFCAGMGPVTSQPQDGYPPAGLSTIPNSAVQVLIGNQPAQAKFAGLAPGFVALYQVNAIVPQGAPTGDAVPVALTVLGQTSPTATMAIQ